MNSCIIQNATKYIFLFRVSYDSVSKLFWTNGNMLSKKRHCLFFPREGRCYTWERWPNFPLVAATEFELYMPESYLWCDVLRPFSRCGTPIAILEGTVRALRTGITNQCVRKLAAVVLKGWYKSETRGIYKNLICSGDKWTKTEPLNFGPFKTY